MPGPGSEVFQRFTGISSRFNKILVPPFNDHLPTPSFSFFSQRAWANPSPRLHEARLQVNGEPAFPCSEVRPVMETNLLDPEEVLANEAFPRNSPSPDFLGTLDRPSPLLIPGWSKRLGVGKFNDQG